MLSSPLLVVRVSWLRLERWREWRESVDGFAYTQRLPFAPLVQVWYLERLWFLFSIPTSLEKEYDLPCICIGFGVLCQISGHPRVTMKLLRSPGLGTARGEATRS